MTVKLGETAPDFHAETTEGDIQFHEWIGDNWAVLFSHPADYTPVCTTELGRVAALTDEFEQRNVKPIGLSVDPLEDHKRWLPDIEETQGVDVDFPIIADPDKAVSEEYGMMHPEADSTHTVRSLFIIDPDKKVRLSLTYPAEMGRNFDELLRSIDALQTTDDYDVATPADWERGERVIIKPSVIEAGGVQDKFGKVEKLKPYLQMTEDPKKSI